MKKAVFVKPAVALFLSAAIGLYLYSDEMRKSALGKDEFLKRESIRFDHYLLHPRISFIITALILCLLLFGLYELICYSIFNLVAKRRKT